MIGATSGRGVIKSYGNPSSEYGNVTGDTIRNSILHPLLPSLQALDSTPIYKYLSPVSSYVRVEMDIYPSLPSFQKWVSITAVGLLFHTLVRYIYNVYFHPLSRFPGPRGAACTRLWLAYMELGRGVSLSTLRTELHQKYGTLPLVLFG